METKKTTIWAVVAVLLVLLIIGILVVKANNKQTEVINDQVQDQNTEQAIDVKHQYKDGKHIFAGKLQVPTPCHKVEASVTPGEIAELNLKIVDSGGVCAQVITDANFYVEFSGKQDQLFVGRLNGEPVNLNQFEVDADLDINEIDIFMKG